MEAQAFDFVLTDFFSKVYRALDKAVISSLSLSASKFTNILKTAWHSQDLKVTAWYTLVTINHEFKTDFTAQFTAVLEGISYRSKLFPRAGDILTILRGGEMEKIENNPGEEIDSRNERTEEFLAVPRQVDSAEPSEIAEKFELPQVELIHKPDFSINALDQFFRLQRSGAQTKVKKEFFRMQLIRGMRKSIRQLNSGKVSDRCLHIAQGREWQERWTALRELFREHKEALLRIAVTSDGPLPGRERGKKSKSRTFNDCFCRDFFSQPYVTAYFQRYCDVVYSLNPAQLCEKLGYFCCSGDSHGAECNEKWSAVHAYARDGMLRQLDVL